MAHTPKWTLYSDTLDTIPWGKWKHYVISEPTKDFIPGTDDVAHICVCRVSNKTHAEALQTFPELVSLAKRALECIEHRWGGTVADTLIQDLRNAISKAE